ncbi:hypothetical protein DER45DRAFT_636509 [Fusarium avenaceum]|nr:hypothetical protein DER45DRAFT_636509 [Fusarium avenaceum]
MPSPNTPDLSSISVTATAAALLALTTPFQQQTGCNSHFTTTSFISSDNTRTTYTIPLVISEQVNSCYPSGWDSVVPESRLCFSPAVCPSGWTYYEMEENGEMASTAYCCDSGYSFLRTDNIVSDILSTACGRWMSDNAMGVNSDDGKHMTVEDTFAVHEAWVITWMSDDTSTLTPSLPTLTSAKRVPTWTPGEVIPDGKYDQHPNDSKQFFDGPVMWLLFLVLPIISFLGILACIGCCVVSHRRTKRRQREALDRAGTQNEPVTLSVELHSIPPNGGKE